MGEIGYTRYSLVFTGEVLPDGRAADAVYIVLNPQHRKFLNEVEVRPLDYDYLFQLSPAPQRLYELLSFPMYGALSNDRPRARLRYSEFCTFAPVARYFDYDPVKKQMSKIHKPHREFGYITRVEFEETQDGKGNRDWEMYYTPGPRALAEFNAFNRRTLVPSSAPQVVTAQTRPPLQSTFDLQGSSNIEEELTKRGIAPNKARELLAHLQPNQDVLQQLEYTDSIIARAPSGKFHNPPGLYIRNIEQNVTPPAAFESTARRWTYQQLQQQIQLQQAEDRQSELAYDEYVKSTIDTAIAGMPEEEVTRRLAEQRRMLKMTYPNMLKRELDELAKAYLRARVKQDVEPSLLPFAQFCSERSRTISCGQ